jgi:hypothetical protein
MPLWRVEVANIFYLTLPAETEEEACALAKHRIDDQRGQDQRILKVEKVEEDR